MASPTELLQSLNEKIDTLPERLASVLAEKMGGGGVALDRVHGDWAGVGSGEETRQKKKKEPGLLGTVERAASAVSGFVPFAGELSQVLSGTRKFGEAIGEYLESLQQRRQPAVASQPLPTVAGQPQIAWQPIVPQAIGSRAVQHPLLPTVARQSQSSVAGILGMGGAVGQSADNFSGESTRMLRELTQVLSTLKTSTEQSDPEPAEDAEQAVIGTQAQEQGKLFDASKIPFSFGDSNNHPVGIMRPPQDVPGAEMGKSGDDGETLSALFALGKAIVAAVAAGS